MFASLTTLCPFFEAFCNKTVQTKSRTFERENHPRVIFSDNPLPLFKVRELYM